MGSGDTPLATNLTIKWVTPETQSWRELHYLSGWGIPSYSKPGNDASQDLSLLYWHRYPTDATAGLVVSL